MKDLGFNEFGEVEDGNDEEKMNIEMAQVAPSQEDDPDGEEEAENAEISI